MIIKVKYLLLWLYGFTIHWTISSEFNTNLQKWNSAVIDDELLGASIKKVT